MSRSESNNRWPSYVYGHGDEPDPRFTLANERTFLAWIRTALALLAGSAALHAFDVDLSESVIQAVSTVLALAGVLCAGQAWVGWARVERALRDARPLPANASRALLAVAVLLAGVVLAVAVLWR